MAWNEPGNNGNGNDPWGGGRRGGDQGPPDIDEVIKNLTKKYFFQVYFLYNIFLNFVLSYYLDLSLIHI